MARVQGKAAFPILSKVFGSLGLLFVGGAAIFALVRHHTLAGYAPAEGEVVLNKYMGRGYRPVVKFQANGVVFHFESTLGSSPPAYQVGDFVPVLYSPANPTDALIDRTWEKWFFAILFGLIGTPFLLVGIGFGVASGVTRQPGAA